MLTRTTHADPARIRDHALAFASWQGSSDSTYSGRAAKGHRLESQTNSHDPDRANRYWRHHYWHTRIS